MSVIIWVFILGLCAAEDLDSPNCNCTYPLSLDEDDSFEEDSPSFPMTSFTCWDRYDGYYADVEVDCTIFHYCQTWQYPTGLNETVKWDFACPESTIFNQKILSCTPPNNSFDCKESPNFYWINQYLTSGSRTTTPEPTSSIGTAYDQQLIEGANPQAVEYPGTTVDDLPSSKPNDITEQLEVEQQTKFPPAYATPSAESVSFGESFTSSDTEGGRPQSDRFPDSTEAVNTRDPELTTVDSIHGSSVIGYPESDSVSGATTPKSVSSDFSSEETHLQDVFKPTDHSPNLLSPSFTQVPEFIASVSSQGYPDNNSDLTQHPESTSRTTFTTPNSDSTYSGSNSEPEYSGGGSPVLDNFPGSTQDYESLNPQQHSQTISLSESSSVPPVYESDSSSYSSEEPSKEITTQENYYSSSTLLSTQIPEFASFIPSAQTSEPYSHAEGEFTENFQTDSNFSTDGQLSESSTIPQVHVPEISTFSPEKEFTEISSQQDSTPPSDLVVEVPSTLSNLPELISSVYESEEISPQSHSHPDSTSSLPQIPENSFTSTEFLESAKLSRSDLKPLPIEVPLNSVHYPQLGTSSSSEEKSSEELTSQAQNSSELTSSPLSNPSSSEESSEELKPVSDGHPQSTSPGAEVSELSLNSQQHYKRRQPPTLSNNFQSSNPQQELTPASDSHNSSTAPQQEGDLPQSDTFPESEPPIWNYDPEYSQPQADNFPEIGNSTSAILPETSPSTLEQKPKDELKPQLDFSVPSTSLLSSLSSRPGEKLQNFHQYHVTPSPEEHQFRPEILSASITSVNLQHSERNNTSKLSLKSVQNSTDPDQAEEIQSKNFKNHLEVSATNSPDSSTFMFQQQSHQQNPKGPREQIKQFIEPLNPSTPINLMNILSGKHFPHHEISDPS